MVPTVGTHIDLDDPISLEIAKRQNPAQQVSNIRNHGSIALVDHLDRKTRFNLRVQSISGQPELVVGDSKC
jgi:hypothetical protein